MSLKWAQATFKSLFVGLLMELVPATSKSQGRGHGWSSEARVMSLLLTCSRKGSWAAVEHMGAQSLLAVGPVCPFPMLQALPAMAPCRKWLALVSWCSPAAGLSSLHAGDICTCCGQARGWHRRQGWGGRSRRPASVYRGRKLQKQPKSGVKAGGGRRDSARNVGLGQENKNKTRTLLQGNEIKRREKQEGTVSKVMS